MPIQPIHLHYLQTYVILNTIYYTPNICWLSIYITNTGGRRNNKPTRMILMVYIPLTCGKNGAGLPRTGKTTEIWTSRLKRGCSFQLIPGLNAGQFSIFILFFGWWKPTMKTGDLETNLLPVHSAEATHCNTWDGSTPHPCSHGIWNGWYPPFWTTCCWRCSWETIHGMQMQFGKRPLMRNLFLKKTRCLHAEHADFEAFVYRCPQS